jgi:hypothetical protein
MGRKGFLCDLVAAAVGYGTVACQCSFVLDGEADVEVIWI